MRNSVFLFSLFIILIFLSYQSLLLIMLALGSFLLFWKLERKRLLLILILVSFVFLRMALTFNQVSQKEQTFKDLIGTKIVTEGIVVNDPQKKEFIAHLNQQVFYLKTLGLKEKIRVSTTSGQNIQYGDLVLVVGKLKQAEPFSNFNYPMFLASAGVYAQIQSGEVYILKHEAANPLFSAALSFKHLLFRRFQQNFPKEQAGLMIALLTGDKNYLSKGAQNSFSLTGTAHIIAVSGFILTLIMLGIFEFRTTLGNKVTLGLIFLAAFLYLVMAGFAPGVIRAALMSLILIICKLKRREYLLLPALLFTASVLLLLNPLLLIYDLGFIFSFLSILGIYLFNPFFNYYLANIPSRFGIREILSSTFSAQLVTAPLTAYYFQTFSIVAPIANLVILPLIPPILTVGYLAVLPLVGKLVAYLLFLPLEYILRSINFLARLPFASLFFQPSKAGVVAIYFIELLLWLWLNQRLKKRP
jgi:competence protein ComEC